jgi:hypothetical protein
MSKPNSKKNQKKIKKKSKKEEYFINICKHVIIFNIQQIKMSINNEDIEADADVDVLSLMRNLSRPARLIEANVLPTLRGARLVLDTAPTFTTPIQASMRMTIGGEIPPRRLLAIDNVNGTNNRFINNNTATHYDQTTD